MASVFAGVCSAGPLTGAEKNGFGVFTGRIKIAVKYHMIAGDMSVLDKFKLVKEAGLDGTELKTNQKVDPKEVREAIDSTGIPVHGVINSADPDIRGAVDLAEYYGGNSVLIVAQENPEMSYEENWRRWQDLIRPVIPHAQEKCVHLCIENVRATFLKEAEEMARFIDEFDSPVVRSYFDTGNTITWTEQPAEHWAKVLGKRALKLDIKDRGHPEFGEPKLARKDAVGTDGGEVNWTGVREELDRVSFRGWATAELPGGDGERLAGIARWMRTVLDCGEE